MADVNLIAAQPREQAGKGSARAARRAGQVPAVIYGNKIDPMMITLDRRSLTGELQSPGFFARLIDIEIDGHSHRVLPRDVQLHPVSDVPIHADFLRLSADAVVRVQVPVEFVNDEKSPGIKRGGVLNVVLHEIEVDCMPDRIPSSFIVDLTGLDIGHSVHAASIVLSEGVTLTISDRDFTIATVAAPTVTAADEEEEAAAAAAAAAEGEEGAVEGEEGAAEGEKPAEDEKDS